MFADLVKHFEGERFRFDWAYPDENVQNLALQKPKIMDFGLALHDAKTAWRQFEFDVVSEEFHEHAITANSRHLTLFDGFVSVPFVYSESFRRGGLNLRPVTVDATGFDHVIIDTPHYISLSGIDRKDVHYVIHDFIPFYDGSMGFDWRQLFNSKVECTLKVGGNAIFNSETTRKYFEQIFPSAVVERHVTIYPPIREEVSSAAAIADRSQPSRYMRAIKGNKRAERRQWVKSAGRYRWMGPIGRLGVKVPHWQPDLPFFCTVLSDEPRKNVRAIVEASKQFVGEVNFVVIGQIDGNRYMRNKPGRFPNLHFTGYLSDERKLDLLRSCDGFIFPSFSEGFGIPIVEAATMGAPVICSDIEVFREVTYDRAYYFNPSDPNDLVRAIRDLIVDPDRGSKTRELKALVDAAFMQDEMAKRMVYLLGGEA
ncbi:glycosyltransferase [Brevundimonas vesicularis]|uniref:glycosyltransferase n=1 Tax=Brevundimonas vesicularis TaxID=41276 RepID=UPI0027D8F552|nr:glycosyltransferase [Brevundimonas vesicularis]